MQTTQERTEDVVPGGYTNITYDQLVERFYWQVYLILYRTTHDREQARDLTQETYLRAWKGWGTVKQQGTLFKWLLTIAIRVTLDAKRHGTSYGYELCPQLTEDGWTAVLEEQVALSGTPEEAGARHDLSLILAEMPRHYRHVIELRAAGYTAREIAPSFGVSPKTIYYWLHDAQRYFAEGEAA